MSLKNANRITPDFSPIPRKAAAIRITGFLLPLIATISLSLQAQPDQLEEIVVYGELIERSLQDNHSSVHVLTGAELQAMNIDDLNDAMARIAGITRSSQGTGIGSGGLSIRGIPDIGIGGSGTGKTTTTSIDGVRISNVALMPATVLSTWDIQQLEVLRGPQSTQSGRSALAGAVIVRSNDPTYSSDYKIRLGYGTDSSTQLAAMANIPLLEDRLALRLAAERRSSDGFVSNDLLGIDDIDEYEKTNLRLGLRWDISDDFSALLRYTFNNWDEGYSPEKVLASNFPARRSSDINAGEFFNRDFSALSLRLRYQITERLALESETARYDGDFSAAFDNDQSNQPLAPALGEGESDFIEQDLRLTFAGDSLTWVLGLYHTEIEDIENFSNSLFSLAQGFPPRPVIGLNLPDNLLAAVTNTNATEITNSAVYGELEWNLNPQWRVIVGGRYDREKLDDTSTFRGVRVSDQLLLASFEDPLDTDFSAFLPKAAVVYQLNDNNSLGFTLQRGYRAGGTAPNSFAGRLIDYDPEYITNYELSLRTASPEQGITANANLFYTDWTDQQTDAPRPGGQGVFDRIVVNAGESALWGFEVEVRGQPDESLQWFGSMGYVSTEFKTFNLSETSLAGNEFPFAPELSFAVGAEYRFDNGVYVASDANYVSAAFTDVENIEANKTDSRALINARVGYRADQWQVFLYVDNLADRDYELNTYSVSGSGYIEVNAPREVGLVFERDF